MSNLNQAGMVAIAGQIAGFKDVTVTEVHMNESLLNPGLQTAIVAQNFVYSGNDFRSLKGQTVSFNLYNARDSMTISNQKIYRMDNRQWMPSNVGQTEEFTLHLCDPTLINDAKSLISKSWKCTSPTDIVDYALNTCAGATNAVIDSSEPQRDYIAENVHPFQVIAQQANVALDGDDPSFLHYMTYFDGGTHYFRSLKKLISRGPVATFQNSDVGKTYDKDYNSARDTAITFEFPCDFDLLSDVLNGVDENGMNINSLMTFNPLNLDFSKIGADIGSCGIGSGNAKVSMTNKGTANQQNGCETDVEKHLHKRQARMGLLEKDKVALRIMTPWQGNRVHAGDVIRFQWKSRKGGNVYGTGDYLITSLTHRIMLGGFSTTTMDCIFNNLGG